MRCVAGLALIALVMQSPVLAQWNQWGGPKRDFTVDGKSLPASFPQEAPRLIWERALGDGESGILVNDETLYTMYRDGGEEVVVALRANSGETVWEHRYDAPIPASFYVKHGDGPHATPLIVGDRIFTVGIAGRMFALDLETGKPLWSHDFLADFDGRSPNCGYASSPLSYGDMVITQVGGKGQAVVAFKQSDGEIVWKSQDFGAGYAATRLIELGGEQQLVVFARAEVAGLDPDSGELKWSHPHATEHGVNASMPVWGEDDILVVSSAYDSGSRGLALTQDGSSTAVEELWFQKKMQVHFGNVIRIGDHLYGTSGDFGPAFLTAVNARSGELVWQKRDVVAKASLLLVGDKLMMIDEKGKLVVASVTPRDVTVHAEHQLVEGRVWAPPTLVGSTLYVRNRKSLMAFDLAKRAAGD